MNKIKLISAVALLGSLLAMPLHLAAADSNTSNAAAKPYPLKTCIVSGEKIGGDMGKPYVFVQDGQEIKLCCKDCLKDFKRDPAKYMKKLASVQKDAKTADAQHDNSAHQH